MHFLLLINTYNMTHYIKQSLQNKYAVVPNNTPMYIGNIITSLTHS